jgi:uncharacterized membrane protein
MLSPPSDSHDCHAIGISADGKIIAGSCIDNSSGEPGTAYVWQVDGTGGALPLLEAQAGGCGATALSGDGKVVAGKCSKLGDPGVQEVPVVWMGGAKPQTVTTFPWKDEYLASLTITAMNSNGSIKAAAGGSDTSAVTSGVIANGGFQYIYPSTTPAEQSFPTGISTSGTVVIGVKFATQFPGQRVFVWTQGAGVSEPIFLELFGNPILSGDGLVIYGVNNENGHGFRWTKATGVEPMVSLGEPKGTNFDGSVVVTKSGSFSLVFHNGTMLDLETLFAASGTVSPFVTTPEFVGVSSTGEVAVVNGYVNGAKSRVGVVKFSP